MVKASKRGLPKRLNFARWRARQRVATELAHHYGCANDRNKAIHYFRLAEERAVARGAGGGGGSLLARP